MPILLRWSVNILNIKPPHKCWIWMEGLHANVFFVLGALPIYVCTPAYSTCVLKRIGIEGDVMNGYPVAIECALYVTLAVLLQLRLPTRPYPPPSSRHNTALWGTEKAVNPTVPNVPSETIMKEASRRGHVHFRSWHILNFDSISIKIHAAVYDPRAPWVVVMLLLTMGHRCSGRASLDRGDGWTPPCWSYLLLSQKVRRGTCTPLWPWWSWCLS